MAPQREKAVVGFDEKIQDPARPEFFRRPDGGEKQQRQEIHRQPHGQDPSVPQLQLFQERHEEESQARKGHDVRLDRFKHKPDKPLVSGCMESSQAGETGTKEIEELADRQQGDSPERGALRIPAP